MTRYYYIAPFRAKIGNFDSGDDGSSTEMAGHWASKKFTIKSAPIDLTHLSSMKCLRKMVTLRMKIMGLSQVFKICYARVLVIK